MDLIFYFLPSAVIKFSWSFLGKDLSSKIWAVLGRNTRFLRNLFDYFESNHFYEWLEIKPACNYANSEKMSNALWEADYSCLDTLVRYSNQQLMGVVHAHWEERMPLTR